jgi:hypothetical protein
MAADGRASGLIRCQWLRQTGLRPYCETRRQGESLVLIPYLAAGRVRYPFQAAEYARHFPCRAAGLRGGGL